MRDGVIHEFWSKKALEDENMSLKEQVAYMQECLDAQPIAPFHWKDYVIMFLVTATATLLCLCAMLVYFFLKLGEIQ